MRRLPGSEGADLRSSVRRSAAARLPLLVAVVLPLLVAVVLPLSVVSWAADDPVVRQRAVEEVMSGVFVRTLSGNVVVDTGAAICDPACAEGLRCESTCRDVPCRPQASPLAHCLRCVWDCVQ